MKRLIGILAMLLAAGSAQAETIAYWPFGANGLNDVSGNGYHLESDGEHVVLDAENGVTLDGLQTLFSSVKAIDLGTAEAVTLEFWVKFDREATTAVSSPAMIFELSSDFNGYDYAFFVDCNDFSGTMLGAWKVYGGYQMTTQTGDTTGDMEWHHVALVLNPKASGNACNTLYVDGVAYAGGTQYNTTPQPTVNWPKNQKAYIGTRNNSQYKFKGQIDDVKISTGVVAPGFFTDRSNGEAASPEKMPAFGTVRATAATETSVTLTGLVESLGAGATSATVSVVDGGDPVTVAVLSEPGEFTYTVTGMTAGGERALEFRLTNNVVGDHVSCQALAQTVRESSTVIAYYSFDDEDVSPGAGNGHDVLADKSGNGNSLWMSGVTVKNGEAKLSGSQTYFSASEWANNRINYSAYLPSEGRDHLTVELWAKFTAGDNAESEAMLVETSGYCGYEGNAYNIYYSAGAIYATVSHPGNWDYSSCGAPFAPDGEWHHFALVVNPDPDAVSYSDAEGRLNCAELYIDGTLRARMPWAYNGYGEYFYKAVDFYNPTFYVGCRANSSLKIVGEIDDLRISSGALVPGQFAPRTPTEGVTYPQPEIESLKVAAVEEDYVDLKVKLSALGDGASYCDLFAVYTKSGAVVTQAIERVTEPSEVEFTISNLEESTTYEFDVYAENDVYDGEVVASRTVTTHQAPKALMHYLFNRNDLDENGRIADHGAFNLPLQSGAGVLVDGQLTLDGASTVTTPDGFSYGGINVLTAECFAKFGTDACPSTGSAAVLMGGQGEPGYNPNTFHLYYVGGETPQIRITVTYGGGAWDCNTATASFTPDGQWHHFAIVIDPNEETAVCARLYIDRKLAAELPWPKNGDNFKPLSFGWSYFNVGSVANDGRYYFKGQIDDVRVYNRALAPAQFQQKRDKGFKPFMFIVR